VLRIPISILCFICAIGLCFAAFIMGSLTPFYLAIFFLVIVFASSNRDLMAQAAIMLLYSRVMIPKLPGDFFLYQLLLFVWVALVVAQNIIDKRKLLLPASWAIVLFYMINIGVVIAVRGFGLQFLGGGMRGGMTYIQTILAFMFYLYSRRLIMTEKQWKRCFVAMALLTFIPLAAQLVFLTSGGKVWQQFLFIRFSFGNLLQYRGAIAGTATTRWTMLGTFTSFYWIAVAMWEYKGTRNVMLYMFFFAISLLSAIAASYRSGVILTGGTLVLIFIIYSKNKRAVFLLLLAAVVIGIPLVSVFYKQMPFSVQRTLTLLPWIDATTDAALDAAQTVGWRKELWARVVALIPKYLLIGRGFSYNAGLADLLSRNVFSAASNLEYYLHTGSFHNGTLELLILLGMFGFLSVMVFVFNEIRVGVRNMNRSWNSSVLKRYYQALFAYFATLSLLNILLGSARPIIVSAPVILGLMWALWQSDQMLGQPKKELPSMQKKRIIVGI